MKLFPVSAMTMLLTDLKLYSAPLATAYLAALDCSEGNSILARMTEPDKQYFNQLMTARRYFLLKEAGDFLEASSAMGKQGQVVLLAAGASPLSIHLAELFPKAQVWDVGNVFINEKAAWVDGSLSNLHFIHSEITDIDEWSDRLHFTGFDPTASTLFVLENLYFYRKPEEMRSIICRAKEVNAIICGDYMVQPALVDDTANEILKRVFNALQGISEQPSMRFYSRLEFATLLDTCGYRDLRFSPLSTVQRERTGDSFPFMSETGSPIEMWTVR